MKIPASLAAQELRREIAKRERVYPLWVSQGKLSPKDSILRLERIKRALEIVMEEAGREEPDLFAALPVKTSKASDG